MGMENIANGIQPNLNQHIFDGFSPIQFDETEAYRILVKCISCNIPASSTPISFTTPKIPKPSRGLSSRAARSAIALPSSRHKIHPVHA